MVSVERQYVDMILDLFGGPQGRESNPPVNQTQSEISGLEVTGVDCLRIGIAEHRRPS